MIEKINAVNKIAALLGEAILDQFPALPELKDQYKLVFDQYITKIDENIQEVKDYKKFTDEEKEKALTDLEKEKDYIECFVRFLQEECDYKLVKRKK